MDDMATAFESISSSSRRVNKSESEPNDSLTEGSMMGKHWNRAGCNILSRVKSSIASVQDTEMRSCARGWSQRQR
jgi:hypothetical protein